MSVFDFCILFLRILYHMEMIQIGRHYYYNKRPIPVPAHRYAVKNNDGISFVAVTVWEEVKN